MEYNIYKRNTNAMERTFGFMAKQIKDHDYVEDIELNISSTCESDATVLLNIEKKDDNKYICIRENQQADREEFVDSFGKFHKYSVILVCGLGTGNYINDIYRQTDQSVMIVVYEPCINIFLELIRRRDISEIILSRRVALVIDGLNEDELIPILRRNITNENIANFKTRVHPDYGYLFGNKIKEALGIVKRVLTDIKVEVNTMSFFSNMYAKNVIGNSPEVLNAITINQLKDAMVSKELAVLVAAGPSLSKNLDLLQEFKGKAFILAVDTAAKVLVKNNLIPDAIITVDGNKPVELLDGNARKVPIIFSADCNSDLISLQKGRKIICDNGESLVQQMLIYNQIPCSSLQSGGSVSNSGFSLLEFLGFHKIVLVGQDLAYSNNRSHVEGSFSEEEIAKKRICATAMVEGVDGTMLPTQPNMLLFKKWFEDEMKRNKTIKVINATEGGANIEGAENKPLNKVIREDLPTEPTDYEKVIESIPPAFNTEAKNWSINYLYKASKDTQKAFQKAVEAQKLYKRLHDLLIEEKINFTEITKIQNKLGRITTYFENNPEMSLIMRSISSVSYALSNGMYDQEEEIRDEARMIEKQGMIMMESIKCVVRNVTPLYDKMLENL